MTKKEKGKKNKNDDLNQVVNAAYTDGIEALFENNPKFKQYEEYIQKHIDKNALGKVINHFVEKSKDKENSSEKYRKEYIHSNIANYIASGEILDDKAKKVVLKVGALEEKAGSWNPISKLFIKRKLEGEKYLENTLEAFQDLYSLFKSGDYAQKMPKLAEAVQTVNNMGFLDSAMDVLESYGLINEKRYNIIKKSIKEKTKENAEAAIREIESKALYKKAAVFITGIIGALMVVTSANMTGGIIGALGSGWIKAIGAILVLISAGLFFKFSRKKNYLRKKKK